jgi:gas vesicle protein
MRRRDDMFAALGLFSRSPEAWIAAVGIFAAGAVLGSGIALLVTPKTGRDLRGELRGRANELSRKMKRSAHDVRGAIEEGKEHYMEARGENGARDWRATPK